MWSQTEKNDFLYEQNRLRCWIEGQGTVLCRLTPEERETARECLKDMPRLFPELFAHEQGLRLIYLYEQGDQKQDAVCWKDVTTDGRGTLYAIGIARGAYPEYLKLIFLHELAHIAVPCERGEHSAAYCRYLDNMIEKFNAATGSQLVNDYGENGKKQG